MTETKPPTLTLGKKLELKRDVDQVRQSFSHGRSKTVAVEVKRRRAHEKVLGENTAAKSLGLSSDQDDNDSKFTKDERESRLRALQKALKEPEKVTPPQQVETSLEEKDSVEASEVENAPKELSVDAIKADEITNESPSPQAKAAVEEKTKEAVEEKAKEKIDVAPITPKDVQPIVYGSSTYNQNNNKGITRAPSHSSNASKSPSYIPPSPSSEKSYRSTTPVKKTEEKSAPTETKVFRADDYVVGKPKPQKLETPTQKTPEVRKKTLHNDVDDVKKVARVDVRKAPVPAKKGATGYPKKLSGASLVRALDGEEVSRGRSMAAIRRARQKHFTKNMGQQEAQKIVRDVTIPETILVSELANRMAVRGADVVKSLMKMGMMVTVNQVIDADTAELVCAEFGHTAKRVSDSDVEIGLKGKDDSASDMVFRAPVVTVMGHVDHGKTSLLDALRSTDVVSGEAGGITQHIGAYQVTMKSGKKITFIDTPGHAAFTEMRARGANLTDVVVLVVAADDGVMPQTIEAINHAKAAGVPIVVAINKMDKPDANVDRIKSDLLQYEIVTEDFGGDVLAIPVSAKKRMNLEKLEEAILLQAEVLDLKSNPNRDAEGLVVESRVDKGRGNVATVLIQRGTLRVGDIFVAGKEWGRVRALVNDRGQKITEATPSMPVEVLGFNGSPAAGDEFYIVETENRAREVADYRIQKEKNSKAAIAAKSNMDKLMLGQSATGQGKELTVVIKTDVQGSLEAITGSLLKLANDEVSVRVLHGAVGGINESDVTLANASGGVVIGFNVRANPQAREFARRENLDIRYYSIIYDVLDDMKAALGGLLSPTLKENFLGYAEIRTVFNITKVGKVAGCYVTEGMVKRGAKVRLLRDNVVIHEGSLKTLKRIKDEVKEVKHGFECGMAFEHYEDIKEGDMIECFEIESIARFL